MYKPKDFQLLVDALMSLPNIGTKNATKYAYHIIKQDAHYINKFIECLNNAKNNLRYCDVCHNLTEQTICNICQQNRDKTLYIVDSIIDLDRIEELKIYHGYYHVLHGEINPKKGINNKHLFIDDIKNHILNYQINEVVIATSLSIPGEITFEYIKNTLESIPNINVYRIGFGLPNNSTINYSDDQTLKFSLLNKKKII